MYNVIGGGVDYDSGTFSIMISAGQTTASFKIAINDDNILEDNEEFKLSFRESSLTGHVMVGNPDETTIIIMDNDGTYVNNA